MADRAELLEATLDGLPEGVALLGEDCRLAFWNQAAQAITGYAALEMVGRPKPESLRPLLEWCVVHGNGEAGANHGVGSETGRGFLVRARHKLGHEVATMVRLRVLRDALGMRIGTAVLFHPAECLDALPHGVTGEDDEVEASQTDLTERLGSQMLAGLARTADFRWWGDRVSLTVSIGAAQAESAYSLIDLLERAKAAMFSSFHLGGNHITAAPEGHSCSPS